MIRYRAASVGRVQLRALLRGQLKTGGGSADDAVATLRAARTPVLQEPSSHFSGHRRACVAGPDGN